MPLFTFVFFWYDEDKKHGYWDTYQAPSAWEAASDFRKEHPAVKDAWFRKCVGGIFNLSAYPADRET